ncbi:MAG: MarR family transcriptional regulator [Alphaproteobacteria bacterium]|nr:MarR family transcriptional regulator [Alphaproteobacteria bacterium]
MKRKEYVRLMGRAIIMFDRLADGLRLRPEKFDGYTRQQLTVLVRLLLDGRAKLKDIARREMVSAPNLCATFRKLELDGLVLRTIDETDRRNTWYSVTYAGEKIARRAIEDFYDMVEKMFGDLSNKDEQELTDALSAINDVLSRMVKKNV